MSIHSIETSLQVLNSFRNQFYSEGSHTAKGSIAHALNDVLPNFTMFPVQPGDTVYRVVKDAKPHVVKDRVDRLYNAGNGWIIKLTSKEFALTSFGSTLFTSEEAASEYLMSEDFGKRTIESVAKMRISRKQIGDHHTEFRGDFEGVICTDTTTGYTDVYAFEDAIRREVKWLYEQFGGDVECISCM